MSKEENLPLYARIGAFVREQIASGQLPEGARLPPEAKLAEMFGTTRSTVAKAMQRLVFEGVVTRRTGSGTFVAPHDIAVVFDPSRIRTFEEQLGKQDGDISYRLLTWGARAANPLEAQKLGVGANTEIFQLERLRLESEAVIGLEIRIIPKALGERFTVQMMNGKSINRILAEDFGQRIARVEGHIRAGLASSLQASRLGVRRGSAVLIREFTLLGSHGQPLVFGTSLYRDHFRIDYAIEETASG